MTLKISLLTGLLASLIPAAAAIKAGPMEYEHGGTKLEGWHAQDADKTGRRPAVLLVHQWLGITDYEKKRAEMLAELGYDVLCADVYGKGVRPPSPKEAATVARCTVSRIGMRATTTPKVRLTTRGPTDVLGGR